MSLVFYQINETTLFATLKISLSKSLFFERWVAGLIKLIFLLEQDIALRNDSLVTEACYLVLVRGDRDRPKEN